MKRRILVVDDEPQVLELLKLHLVGAGYSVMALSSGKDALLAVETNSFDLLVLDLGLPDIDGFDVLRAVRAKKPDLKVIATSGYLSEPVLKIAGFLGSSGQLQKPISQAALLDAVRHAIGE